MRSCSRLNCKGIRSWDSNRQIAISVDFTFCIYDLLFFSMLNFLSKMKMNVRYWVQMVTDPARTVAHAPIAMEVTHVLVNLDGRVINVKRVRHKLTAKFKINFSSTAKE